MVHIALWCAENYLRTILHPHLRAPGHTQKCSFTQAVSITLVTLIAQPRGNSVIDM
jgi:hypothetical protein